MPGTTDWNALAGVLTPDQLDGIEADFEAFALRTGSADRDLFVQYLHQQGSITDEQLGKALRIKLRPEPGDLRDLERRVRGDRAPELTYATMSPDGHYALLGRIGIGGMGEVWVGKDHDLKRKVAYKELSAQYLEEPAIRQRFLAEARITAQLDHPGIPPVHTLEIGSGGRLGYAMKLVDGRTLRQLLDQERANRAVRRPEASPLEDRLEWFLKACDAVAYAHARGVLHRDLKPDNLMIGAFGEVYVMDWGLARLIGAAPEALPGSAPAGPGVTLVGRAIGTPSYMSPEQARGENDELDARSDQYALGLVLQEILTLRAATRTGAAQDVVERASRAVREPVPREAPRELAAIIDRATAADPARRYKSVAALAVDLRRYLRGEPVRALPANVLRNGWRSLVRHRERVLVAGLALMLLAVLFAAGSGGVVIGTGWIRQQRELRIGQGIAAIGEHAHRIDDELARYERDLEIVASAAAELLLARQADPDAPVLVPADFDDPARTPDLFRSERFGRPVSASLPVFLAAPGTSLDVFSEVATRLARLRHALRTVADPTAKGPPTGWVYVGTESGVHCSWPGHGGFATDFDPRLRPWYAQAREASGPVWGAPYVDANGMGLVVAVSRPISAPDGTLLGVAGLDVPLDHVIDDLLAPSALPLREAWLLDGHGRIVVRSSERSASAPVPYPDAYVVDRARAAEPASFRRDDGEWVMLWPLRSIGWSWLVEAPEAALVGP